MDRQASNTIDLEDVRREIDRVDDALLKLLQQRFEVVDNVKLAKEQQGRADQLPLRPAREAMILRRLTENNNSLLPNDLLLQIWRSIICCSTLSQAPIRINGLKSLLEQPSASEAISSHFVGFPVKSFSKIKTALNSTTKSNFELCAVSAESKWLEHLSDDNFSELSVILTLPYKIEKKQHHIIILGKMSNEPTGDDETLLVSQGKLPRDFVPAPLWEVKTADGYTLTSLPGYLSAGKSPLVGLINGNAELALKVLGRYPSPFEV